MREHKATPSSETEWLMMPGDSPDQSTSHNDAVLEAILELTEEERALVEAYFYERATYEQLGKRLDSNKVNAWRKVQRIISKLEKRLVSDPVLSERYKL